MVGDSLPVAEVMKGARPEMAVFGFGALIALEFAQLARHSTKLFCQLDDFALLRLAGRAALAVDLPSTLVELDYAEVGSSDHQQITQACVTQDCVIKRP